jgi:hypothetical protein
VSKPPKAPFARNEQEGIVEAAFMLQQVINGELTAREVKDAKYHCCGCILRLTPVAIWPNSRRPPHFREQGDHEPGCQSLQIWEEERKRRDDKGKSKFPKIPEKILDQHPSRLVLDIKQDSHNPSGNSTSPRPEGEDKDAGDYKGQRQGGSHEFEVYSISPLVEDFLKFPNTRNRPLFIPGVEAKTYTQIFQRLNYRAGFYFEKTRIYFDKFYYQNSIDFKKEYINLHLMSGDWEVNNLGKSSRNQGLHIHVDLKNWTALEKKDLERKIYNVKEEIRKPSPKSEQRKYIWLFFLGQQYNDIHFEFQLLINSPRLIHFQVTSLPNIEPFSKIFAEINRDHTNLASKNHLAEHTVKSLISNAVEQGNNPVVSQNITEQEDNRSFLDQNFANDDILDALPSLENSQFDSSRVDDSDIDLIEESESSQDKNIITDKTPVLPTSAYSFFGSELTPEDPLAQNNISKSKNINPVSSAGSLDVNSTSRASQEKVYSKNLYTSLPQKAKKTFKVPSRKQVKHLIQTAQSYTQKIISRAFDISLKSSWVNKNLKKVISLFKIK